LEWTATSEEDLVSDGAHSRFLKSQNSKSVFRLSRIGASNNDIDGNMRTPAAHREKIKERMKSKNSRFMTQSEIRGVMNEMQGNKGKSMHVQPNSPQG